MTKRRGPGEHSVYQLPDGTWVASMEAGRTASGKRKRIVRKAQTKKAALAKLEEAKAQERNAGFVPDQRTTVETMLRWWLSDVVPGTVRDSTVEGYRFIVDAYLIPNLGGVRLAKLGPEHVQRMLRNMEDQGLSPRTRRHARSTLVGALRRAERFGMVTRNAAAMVDPPRLDTSDTEDDTLSAAEVRLLLAQLHAQDDELVAVAELALRLGLRLGELLALRWADVDLEAGTLRVRATLKRVKREKAEDDDAALGKGSKKGKPAKKPARAEWWKLDEPKTKAGDRVIPLSDHLVDELKAHRRRQLEARMAAGRSWQDFGFVFTSSVGTPIDPRNLQRWWRSHFTGPDDENEDGNRVDLAPRPFHSTRRTAITLMAEAGVPLQVAANIVGHSSIRMTAEVYNRVQPRAQRSALDLLETYMEGRV